LNVVCVIGMHRSGTSLVSGVLNLLGADLGPSDRLMGPKDDNPSGFWENLDIAQINDDLLAALGGSWMDPRIRPDGWHTDPSLAPLRDRAAAVIAEDFGGADSPQVVAWKDPRLSLLLPFWRQLAPITATVHSLRHPAAVAASLRRRDGMDVEVAAALWLRYTVEGIRAAPESLVVWYDDLLEDPGASAKALAGHAGLEAPTDDVLEAIERFSDRTLAHGEGADGGSGPWMGLAERVFDAVRGGEGVTDLFEALHERWVTEELHRSASAEVAELRKHRDILVEQEAHLTAELAGVREELAVAGQKLSTMGELAQRYNDELGAAERTAEELGVLLASAEARAASAERLLERTGLGTLRRLWWRLRAW
jgi:hypothetical protein